ncbi:hypothetical protein Gotri_022845 [Gossypium trilobum]|uniref:ribose-5-phosphate isomerase n=1 Tax=Gossypium trilobum TaxID=34281 RepID=A0A7J9DHX6_9ROSI|nr:hypothetical protein [Gossypium trilobum]
MAIAWSEKASYVEVLSRPPSLSPPVILTQDELKKIAAYKAVEFVESGMVLGLGTGSTAKHAVDRIGELLRLGKLKNIVGIPTSKKTQEQAKFICIVDESKLVKHLGGSGLAMPVEVVPFCWKFTANKLQNLFEDSGCVAKLRNDSKGKSFVTDNGNYIVDLYLKKDIGDLQVASDAILRIAGVVEHGMFLDMATTVIVAGELGITIKNK